MQWRIYDFPDGGANRWVKGKNLLSNKIFAENWMKMTEIGLNIWMIGCVPIFHDCLDWKIQENSSRLTNHRRE